MKLSKSLPLRNLAGKPVRTAVLIILTALLSLTIFGGTLIDHQPENRSAFP